MTSGAGPFVRIRGLGKRYGNVEALRDVSLDAHLGEILAIVGTNGAGKSTLVKMISGVLGPDKGELWLDGERVENLSPALSLRKGIAVVYQDLALVETGSVSSNIFLGGELTRWGALLDGRAMDEASEALLRRMDVVIARALRQGGRLLIMDEPTAAMGPVESRAVLRLLKRLVGEGYGIVLISHNLNAVFEVADRICVLRQGEIAADLPACELTPERIVALMSRAERNEESC